MARDEQHGDPGRTPVDFPEPVGLAWGSNIFDDREAGARAWAIVSRALEPAALAFEATEATAYAAEAPSETIFAAAAKLTSER